jgi:hypothetical protein
VNSAREQIAERNYQLKPAARGWREIVASLRGRETGSRGTSAVESREDCEESSEFGVETRSRVFAVS